MQEIWKDIKGFDGRYQVSNMGRVRSLDWPRHKGRIMKPAIKRHGYCSCCLRDGQIKITHSIHRLVAEAFIPNPDNLPQINHKDEDKSNNRVDNLEWCTPKYNSNYGTRKDRIRIYNISNVMRPVVKYDIEGNLIDIYESLSEAANKTGLGPADISGVCKGRRKSSHGYIFRFLNSELPKRKMTKGYNKPFLDYCKTLRKKVCLYDLKGNLINVFDSIKDACNTTGISWSCVHGTLSGKRNHTHGYIFKFEGDDPPQFEVKVKRPIRKVLQYDLKGNLINTFDTIAEASRNTGICLWCIHGTLKGKRKKTHGYVFKFK